jgi:transcriptional regulator with GAF, ATPase, and Fis domain
MIIGTERLGESLRILHESVAHLPHVAGIGTLTTEGDDTLIFGYADALGRSVYQARTADVSSPFRPSQTAARRVTEGDLDGHPQRLVESRLRLVGFAGGIREEHAARSAVVFDVPDSAPPASLIVGVRTDAPLSDEQVAELLALSARAGGYLSVTVSPEREVALLRRLAAVEKLLPALFMVLDVRQIFDRLSALTKSELPHDFGTLGLLNDSLEHIDVHAETLPGSAFRPAGRVPYPPVEQAAWLFRFVDDLQSNPFERHEAPAQSGGRSSLRAAVRLGDVLIAVLSFTRRDVAPFTVDDLVVARRIADYVALALSHQRLAEESRRTAALRERAANLELLDALLVALVDAGGLAQTFGRISEIAQKVIAHDAAALMVRLPDGKNARVYASTGVPQPPAILPVPPELLANPDWESDIFDDLRNCPPHYKPHADAGWRGLLRVPIRLDGTFAGALVLLSKTVAAFSPPDVLVARRLADRMALTIAREREQEAAKRADEASERASKLETRVRALTEELDARTGHRRVMGESKPWRRVLTQATQVAATDTTVLLLGESGTGKEVVARFLHRASPRTHGPFIALNCAALPEQLLEAELFGYERGAYTGAVQSKPGQLEQAAGGTLFLDEVGEMSPPAQAKFLRVLQEREFQRLGGTRVLRTDARIVAATNRDLARAITLGQFREDLYYRLNVFAINLPPLRERREDILPLSEGLLAEICRGIGRPPAGISHDARERLMEYPWPGNVRELRNILERAAILCEGGLITSEHLAVSVAVPPAAMPVSAVSAGAAAGAAVSAAVPAAPASATDLQAMERQMIEQALQTARFNKSKAAKTLGLTRHQLYIRMRKYGFE